MKKTNLLKFFLLTLCPAVFFSCLEQIEEPVKEEVKWEEGAKEVPVQVTFRLDDIRSYTKSSFSTDEDVINNMSLLVYKDGLLVSKGYKDNTTQSPIVLTLLKGEKYNMYALANCGKVEFATESELLSYRHTISELNELNNGYPMCWNKNGYIVSDTAPIIGISLERLISKVTFSLDKGVLDGLEVTSVRLMQSSAALCPFGTERYALSSDEVIDGDFTTPSDLNRLNAGGDIVLYVPENCQGTLLEGNTDPWEKIPSNMGGKEDRCTYIEVKCTFADGFALSGNATYRMYLGQDNCSNFDIVRNSHLVVSLALSSDGWNKISWKVESDVQYNSSLGSAYVKEGNHPLNEMYIGEINLLGLRINAYLENLLGEGLPGYTLGVRGSNGNINPAFQLGEITYSGGDYTCEIKCLDATTGTNTLCLFDSKGKYITNFDLDDGALNGFKPLLTIGDGKPYRPQETIGIPQDLPCPKINGDIATVYLYLTDNHGDNLYTSYQYDFDLSLFSLPKMDVSLTNYTASLFDSSKEQAFIDCYSADVKRIASEEGYAFQADISIENNGYNPDAVEAFSIAYQGKSGYREDSAELRFSSDKTESVSRMAQFDIIRPEFYLGGYDSFSPILDTRDQTYMAVYNPSNIDFLCKVHFLGAASNPVASAEPLYFLKGGYSDENFTSNTIDENYSYTGISTCLSIHHSHSDYTDITIADRPYRLFSLSETRGADKLGVKGKGSYITAYVCLTTLSDDYLYYSYKDISGGFIRPDGTEGSTMEQSYVWGWEGLRYQGAGWYTKEHFSGLVHSYVDNDRYPVAVANLNNLVENPVKFTVRYNEEIGAPEIEMSNNYFGCEYKCTMEIRFITACTWAYNNAAERTTSTYVHTYYNPIGVTLSGKSAKKTLITKKEIEDMFENMNRNYWHENCTNGVNLSANRYSEFSLPVRMECDINIFTKDYDKWVPITVNVEPKEGKITLNRIFYTNTERGWYADKSMTNPDGSSRGKHDKVDNYGLSYSHYETIKSTTFDLTFRQGNYFSWNQVK